MRLVPRETDLTQLHMRGLARLSLAPAAEQAAIKEVFEFGLMVALCFEVIVY